ncbi:orotidine-5'-phosphate decarboxylase [Streptomyces sp. 3MP-14]|uniref:Orotidine 5'-phosphate decarboxylase n=1 Tax=Streptomyces mimosae TaxID=2586635 RepID=A0A5N6A1W8_9ACTN|nr:MULTISPECIES: orotidine-5'-phosphate decarboxylase [Streptomyces]KAB8162661.1 orotidine-5'-phosphate decarboxylase [Streptomyces mimosae]KAB8174487.1 orotidine-5'-phosphate decarboxylase [Streptomyces sp. 3MP-14]
MPPSAGEPFGARLRRAMDQRGPLCVGIDPHPELLAAWQLPDSAEGLARFADTVVAALADRVAVLKPQSAFFERHGSAGVAVLERAVADARSAGALVLLDVKRGDIGSTVAAYAGAYFGEGAPLRCDAITLTPYLGYESLRPALDRARADGAGAFVLARTSNPEGAATQTARTEAGVPLAQTVLNDLARENAGAEPWGSFGAVVGATAPESSLELTINGPLLAPGLGAQGATADDLPRVFGPALRQVLPSASRSVLRRGPGVDGLRAAAEWEAAELARVLA